MILHSVNSAVVTDKKLNRGISRATDNVNLVSQARSEILNDSCEQEYCIETPIHTFTLPDINCYPGIFQSSSLMYS